MNVAFDPWIPVVTTTGERRLASLYSVFFYGETFADLAVRPHERVSLMRLFICVAHASLNGPKDYDEWIEVPKRLPESVLKYLKQWKDSFELFNKEKPWLQVAGLDVLPSQKEEDGDDEKGWSPLSKLSFIRASGNNSTLFDHESNGGKPNEFNEEEIALNLLTYQNFFVAGGKTSSRIWDHFKMKNPPNPKGGPCSGKSILYTFLRGKDLFESIRLNLNSYEDLNLLYGNYNDWLGKPLWEFPITSPNDKKAIANATKTHIGRLVPQTRMLRVNEDRKKVLLGPGFTFPKFQDEKNAFFPDLFATIVRDKKKATPTILSAKPGHSIWRELHSLNVRTKSDTDTNRGPLCLLNVPENQSCDIIVNALITNPKQAAELVDLIESVFHIPAHLRSLEGASAYEYEVKISESWSNRLGGAIEEYRMEVDGAWKKRIEKAKQDKWVLKNKLHSKGTTHYWTSVEKNLPLLMAHIEAIGTNDHKTTRDAWRKMLFASVCDSYKTACAQETSRQIRAFVKGWEKLTASRKRTEPTAIQ